MAGVDFRGLRPKNVWPRRSFGGGARRRTAPAWGLAQFGREVFCPKAAAGGKTVAGAYYRGRGACTQYDPKVILGAKAQDPKGDAYYSSPESDFVNPETSVCVCKNPGP